MGVIRDLAGLGFKGRACRNWKTGLLPEDDVNAVGGADI